MAWLTPLAILGQGLLLALTLVLARSLDLADFEAYVIAAAVFTMMVTAAPLGAEKLALRVTPALLDVPAPGYLRGYIRWAIRRGLAGSVIVIALALLWAFWPDRLPREVARAVALACLAVPAGVAAHLGLELLTAAGRPRQAAVAFRVVLPGTALGLVGLIVAFGDPGAEAALLAWGASWIICALLLGWRLAAALPRSVRTAAPIVDPGWNAAARPLWLYRMAVAAMAQVAILALDWLGATPASVGAYAAATGIAGLAVALATATNRAYARDLALLLDRGDHAEIDRRRRRRLKWVTPAVVGFLILAFVFSEGLLGLFRPEFAAEGVLPLRLIAVGAAVSITFSLAPTYLKYRRRHDVLFITVAACAGLQVALLGLLIPRFGATGAAAAYALAVAVMYASLAFISLRDLMRLRAGDLAIRR